MAVTSVITTYRTLLVLKRVIKALWVLFKEVVLRGRSFTTFFLDNKLGFFMLITIMFLLFYVLYLKESRPIHIETELVMIRNEDQEVVISESIPNKDKHQDHPKTLDTKVILRKSPTDVDDTVRDLIKNKLRKK